MRTRTTRGAGLLALAVAGALLGVGAGDGHQVWWEGEDADRHNFDDRSFTSSWLKNTDGLSGGRWLNNGTERGADELFAVWKIDVPAAGEYDLWARKFWKHGPFRWRFDEQKWRECGRDVALADSFELQKHISANWVHLGKVKLKRGARRFELRLLAKKGEKATACFDAFLLTQTAFTPRGKLKPGQKSGQAADGWWAFEPDVDPLDGEARLDLRHLNEERAGASGFVTRGEDGTFRAGDGTELRFWGVNCGPEQVRMSPDQVDYLAARLAKSGVNAVRIHGPIFDRGARDLAAVDAVYLEKLLGFVAALKEQGIYSVLSFHFPLWVNVKPTHGIAGYDAIDNKRPFALLYFEPKMQAAWRAWAKKLLTKRGPKGLKPLAKEPAVAIVEIVNEDSLFFWTFTEKNVPLPHWQRLEKLFSAWLAKRHGSVKKALAAWAGAKHPRDATDHAGLFEAWHMTGKGSGPAGGAKHARMSEQVRFLAGHQRAFYAETARWLREDVGLRALVSASNWHTTDPERLEALERWTYTAGDVIDRHGYFGGRHEGPRSAYAVDAGDRFASRAAVSEPAATLIPMIQYEGFPSMISEIGWPNPNRHRADAPLLCSAYGALQGVDGYFHFAINGPAWSQTVRKFPVSVPSMLGQFPAAALQYRRGDVRESDAIIRQVLSVDDLFALKGSGAAEPQNLDELRRADVPDGGAKKGAAVSAIDPLAYLVGKVERRLDGDASRSLLTDLAPHVDRAKKIARSATGELTWDWGRGLVTVDTARSQAATGFLGRAGAVALGDVTIECGNEYATVHVIALDDAALAKAKRILVQAFTEERPFGWRTDGDRIADLGGPPLNVRDVDATVTIRGLSEKATVTALDANGRARGAVTARAVAGGLAITLPRDALYLIVERR